MQIFDKNGKLILDVIPDDASRRNRGLMRETEVELSYSLVEHVKIPLYSYIDYEGERYRLWRPENFMKHGTRNHEYTVLFKDYQELLKKYKYKNLSEIPYELKFPITAKPSILMQILVDNLNLYDSGWEVGDCIEAPEKVLAINHEYCYDVLQRIAQEFNTEWEIVGKTIHLRKVEYNKDTPLPLSYGRGNGFRPGVGRQNRGDKSPTTILHVQGGDRNIDYSKYNSKTLLLPKSVTLEYGGRIYKTDPHGMMITRGDRPLDVRNEDSYDASDIYPSRVGQVTEVTVIDAGENRYSFTDVTIPDNLDFEECLIPGTTMTVVFQTGALAGREFDVAYSHINRTFEIIPATLDGFDMPNETFKPALNDKYAVFHVMLPEAYISDNTTQTGASWDMFREAVRYMYDVEEEQFSFSGELDGVWAKKNWLEIGGKIKPGGYVSFTDAQFQEEPVLIRITGVTDYLNRPCSPQLDLSNAPVGGFLGSDLGKIAAEEVVNKARHKDSLRYTSLRWRDTIEMAGRLENALLDFTGGINPVTVNAMMMYLGSESSQFVWVTNKTAPAAINHDFDYNSTTKVFSSPAGIIQHMTLGIDTLAPGHDVSEYKFWDIAAYASPPLTSTGPLWLYVKCAKNGTSGTFLFSENAIGVDSDANYYHFLAGHLGSEYQGTRSFAELFGFSEWTPGALRINKIISIDGMQYWDMVSKRFRIGDDSSFLSFNVDRPNTLVLKGTVVQSPAGDTDYLGIDRGNYVSGTTYYPGDLVKYTNGNIYKCIQQTTTIPTNATYWKIVTSKGDKGDKGDTGRTGSTGASGATGAEGQGYLYAYYPSNSLTPPSRPATGGREFSSSKIYYSNAARRDVVKYRSTYYIYAGSDGYSGGWIFKNERLESQSGGAYLDRRTGNIDVNGSLTRLNTFGGGKLYRRTSRTERA